jgi:hypothetical protein
MNFGQCFLYGRQSSWLTETGSVLVDCASIETRIALVPSFFGNNDKGEPIIRTHTGSWLRFLAGFVRQMS